MVLTLSCPCCGAPVDVALPACAYCRTPLKVKTPPRPRHKIRCDEDDDDEDDFDDDEDDDDEDDDLAPEEDDDED